jgi:bacterioferritin-associated ferredoxin
MIICICNAVSDRQIKSAVKNGAASLRDLTRELGVGTCCGKCVPEAKACLSAALDSRSDAGAMLAYFPRTELAV